jgi:hypothetical protein
MQTRTSFRAMAWATETKATVPLQELMEAAAVRLATGIKLE